MWSFERFFTDVTRILSKKKIHIFFVNRLSEHREEIQLKKLWLEKSLSFSLRFPESLHKDNAEKLVF